MATEHNSSSRRDGAACSRASLLRTSLRISAAALTRILLEATSCCCKSIVTGLMSPAKSCLMRFMVRSKASCALCFSASNSWTKWCDDRSTCPALRITTCCRLDCVAVQPRIVRHCHASPQNCITFPQSSARHGTRRKRGSRQASWPLLRAELRRARPCARKPCTSPTFPGVKQEIASWNTPMKDSRSAVARTLRDASVATSINDAMPMASSWLRRLR
mmetsp:Transcript_12456/g.29631  ORF Transcript_12456/g.29631 Transcript_12456/m.29631 type:complete len:218 (-) Transcript_12456:2093-2746(-)